MTWVLDIIAIFFVFFFSLYGLIKGSYYMIIDTLLVVVCIAGAGVGAFLTVQYGLTALGIVDGFAEIWVQILGFSKIAGVQETLNMVAYYIAFGLLTVVLFVIYGVILHSLRKLLLKGVQGLRNKVPFIKFLGNFLGFVVNFAISAGIVLVVMAFFHSFQNCEIIYSYTNEALQACDVLGLIYDINPLNPLLEGVGPAIEAALGNFLA
ncbi:MAG: hypothetical protein J6R88_02090 [Clostridia bacterium]|nr:hypothetical protein [Clostridia bacterium]